jgi:hypothetical protein
MAFKLVYIYKRIKIHPQKYKAHFITCLLQEKQGYPESKKEQNFPSHILSHVFCRKSKAILNPKRNTVFHHIFYHMSFAGKARLS